MGKSWEIAITVVFGEILPTKPYLRAFLLTFLHAVLVIGIVISALVFVRMRHRRTGISNRPAQEERSEHRIPRCGAREMRLLTPVCISVRLIGLYHS